MVLALWNPMLATQVPSPVKAPDVCETRRLHRPVRRGTRRIMHQQGLAKTPAGRTIDRTRSAPGRGFVRPMDAPSLSGCTADAFARRVPHARGVIATNPRVGRRIQYVFFGNHIDARKHPRLAPSGARRLRSRRCNRVVVLVTLTTTTTRTNGLFET